MKHLYTLLLLPFFVSRLLIALVIFGMQVVFLFLAPAGPILVFSSMFILYCFVFFINSVDTEFKPAPSTPHTVNKKTKQEATLLQEKIVSNYQSVIIPTDSERLTQAQNTIETILLQNQTHRDVLLNAAIIYAELNNEAAATALLEKAKYSDPNHPLFVD